MTLQAEDAFYSLHLSTFFGEKIEIHYAKSDWKSIKNKNGKGEE